MNIHGGIEENDVIHFTLAVIEKAKANPLNKYWIFYDEINTTDCMGLFKEIQCDRTIHGIELPQNISIISACNPYMKRKRGSFHPFSLMILLEADEQVGLAFQHETSGSNINDPLSSLVYR